jgi:hypothetical protein
MFVRNLSVATAIGAALAFAGMARAGVDSDLSMFPQNVNQAPLYFDDATTMPNTMGPDTAGAAVATAPPVAPMGTLNKSLNDYVPLSTYNLSVTGYVEGSWTYSAHPPAGNILTDRMFDTKTESIEFDGVDLNISRGIADPTKAFDVGFALEQMYGWDSAYIHADGLTGVSKGAQASAFAGPTSGTTATIHPKAQYDLTQANVVLSFGKLGNGLTVLGGKFLSPMGYETINTVANNTNDVDSVAPVIGGNAPATGGGLYSHSYIFREEPFTLTGLLGTYSLLGPTAPGSLTVTGGISRGWDQSTEDDNGSIDYIGQLRYVVAKQYILQLSGTTGDESASSTQDGWRTVLDFVGSYAASDQLFLGVNGVFAWQAQDKNPLAGPFGYGGTGVWYGAAAYAKYVQSDYLTFNARAEWFDDQNGAAPYQLSSSPANVNTPNQFYEVTIGVAITPFPATKILNGFTIRPEGRWDYSDHAAFNGGAEHDQWTGALEAYFAF